MAGPGKPGRPPGKPNAITAEVRQILKAAIDKCAPTAARKLEELLEADPAAGLKAFGALAEFVIPKLGRLEHTGEDGGAIQVVVRTYGDEK